MSVHSGTEGPENLRYIAAPRNHSALVPTANLGTNSYAATSIRNVIWGANEPWQHGANRASESNWPHMSLMKTGRSEFLSFRPACFVATKSFPPIERNSLQLPSKTGYFHAGFNNLAV